MCVCRQPDVVLGDKELQAEAAEPGKEAGVTSPDEAEQVPQENETHDLGKRRKKHNGIIS